MKRGDQVHPITLYCAFPLYRVAFLQEECIFGVVLGYLDDINILLIRFLSLTFQIDIRIPIDNGLSNIFASITFPMGFWIPNYLSPA